MSFFGKLGIDPKLLIAQIINFGLLLWLLKKLIYQPVIKKIREDEKKLSKAEKQAEKLKQEREELEKKKQQEISEAKKKARSIIKEAEETEAKIKEEAHKEAEEEKEAVINQIRDRLKDIENDQNPKGK